jgi:MFS superfamily sulfate permease-like transporter
LVVVAVGILMQVVMARVPELALSAQHMVDIPNIVGVTGLVSVLRPPDLSMLWLPAVWVSAATLAIVASLESLLGVEAVDKLDPLKRVTPSNRELMAQGAGNMVSGMLGGLPVTSVVVRSSANVQAGAVSKRSTILHGVLMLFGVLLVPTVIDMIPYAALAAILMVTGYKLVKVNTFKEFHAKGWEQFIPFVVTILAILFSDLLTGIVIGIFVGLFFMMRSNFRTTVLLVKDGENHLLRLRKDVSFLNKPIVKQRLASLPNGSYILIDTNPADFIDQDVLEVIREFIVSAPARNIRVEVKRSMQGSIHPMLVMSEQPHVS